jgi:hypothetical protein
MYEALQASGVSQEFIIQDLALPAKNTVPFLEFVDKQLGIYPLWLCPLAVDTRSPLHFNQNQGNAVINVGVWGYGSRNRDEVTAKNRSLESTLHKLHGRKWLYAYAYYTDKEFWDIYDKQWYDALRAKYHATTLPNVYDKTCRHTPQPISGRRGILFALTKRKGIRMISSPSTTKKPELSKSSA